VPGAIDFSPAFEHQGSFVIIGQMVQICRDPKDDKFLDVAINAEPN